MELSGIRLDLLAQTRFLFFSVGLSSSQMDQLCCAELTMCQNLGGDMFSKSPQYQIDCIIERGPTSFNLA